MLIAAIRAQAMDNCGIYFPADTFEHRQTEPNLPLTFECSYAYVTMRQFEDRIPEKHGRWWNGWFPLTTPFAYCKTIPEDPFNSGQYYGYTSWLLYNPDPNYFSPYAILYSPGPDRKENIPLLKLRTLIDNRFKAFGYPGTMLSDKEFKYLSEIISPILYDPTNGINSSGDLIWFLDPIVTPYGWRRDQDPRWNLVSINSTIAFRARQEQLRVMAEATVKTIEQIALEPTPKTNEVLMPPSFYQQMTSIGIYSKSQLITINEQNLDGIRNKLGVDYTSFFKHPRRLTAEEKAALETWKKSSPEWWKMIDQFSPFNRYQEKINLPAQSVYPLLPLFGKSQILLAAEDWGQNKRNKALQRMSELEGFLYNMYFPESQMRIKQELLRLVYEIKNGIYSEQSAEWIALQEKQRKSKK